MPKPECAKLRNNPVDGRKVGTIDLWGQISWGLVAISTTFTLRNYTDKIMHIKVFREVLINGRWLENRKTNVAHWLHTGQIHMALEWFSVFKLRCKNRKDEHTFKLQVRQEVNDSVDDVSICYSEGTCGGKVQPDVMSLRGYTTTPQETGEDQPVSAWETDRQTDRQTCS